MTSIISFLPARFHTCSFQNLCGSLSLQNSGAYISVPTPPTLLAVTRTWWIPGIEPGDGIASLTEPEHQMFQQINFNIEVEETQKILHPEANHRFLQEDRFLIVKT